MARTNYQYDTSPRKVQPEQEKVRKSKKQKPNIKIVKEVPRQEIKLSNQDKMKQVKGTIIVIAIFTVLLTISYRNSVINEKFTQVQKLKQELSMLQKENEQTRVNIENGLNLNNIEKLAKEKLGMQKLTNKQTVYVSLPKKDYTEPAAEEISINTEKSWIDQILEQIFKK